jgi:hypothetical protein
MNFFHVFTCRLASSGVCGPATDLADDIGTVIFVVGRESPLRCHARRYRTCSQIIKAFESIYGRKPKPGDAEGDSKSNSHRTCK